MRSLSVRQTLLIANFQAAFFKVVRFSRATLKNVSISSPFERSTVLSDTCQTGAEGSSLPETRADATVEYPAQNKFPGQQDTYWQPRWKILIPDQAELEVVDGSGVITWYYNYALSRRLQREEKLAGTPISEEQAIL